MTGAEARPGRILLVACGALAREVVALKALNGWDHMDVSCLPALLHNRPDRIPAALRARIRAGRRTHGEVLVLYGDCGTGGALDAVLVEEGAERIEGPHCYAFLAGAGAFDGLMEEEPGSFFLTDFLARQFDRLVWRGLGLDRHPELRDAYFAHYRRVVHLVQQPDPAIAARAAAAAARLGLPLVTRVTGLGGLSAFLAPRVA
ncbi:DUF1638 domain-containing protein [Falsiroseomonas sp. CW058]|uniref:DUF1638 domain-containing protein n=1 Tax=Falsiroseomonas sp. CW058 TaxID=3388664 RepID=UPI003D313CCA